MGVLRLPCNVTSITLALGNVVSRPEGVCVPRARVSRIGVPQEPHHGITGYEPE